MRLSRGEPATVVSAGCGTAVTKSVTTAPGRRGRAPRAGVDCLVFSTVSSRWHAMLDARWVLDTRAIAPARDTGDCEAAEQCNSRSRPERERHEHGHERTPVEKPRPYRGHAANRNPARRKEKGPAPTPAARGPLALSPTAPRATRPLDPSKRPFNNPLVTPHPRAITCAREPNRPALVESATISRSRSPAPVQNVTSTSRVRRRGAQTGKARKPLRCPVITAWSVETGAGGPPMAMAVAANHALTRPGPTCFSKTGSLRSGRHMLHCWAPLSSATAVLSSVALESLAGAGATVTVRGARTSVTSHLWLHRTHRERQGFLIRELPGFLIRSFWVLQFTIWGCMAPRSPRSPAPPASCE